MKREGDFMGNVQAVIDLPEQLYLSLSASGLTKEKIATESRKLLALKYFRDRILSLGRSAELSGLSKWDFIEFLNDNDVPVLDYEEDELTRELETAEKLVERLKK
jgi:predicted HTH domain antitoxin